MSPTRLLDDILAWFDRFCRDPDDLVRQATYGLAEESPTRAQIEERLGAFRSWTPGLPHVRDTVLEYTVDTPGLPYACKLYATFGVDDAPFEIPAEGDVALQVGAERTRVFRPGEAHPGMDALPDLLRLWAERVCTVPAGTPEQTLAALGIDGSPRPVVNAFAVEPPPPGIGTLRLDMRQIHPVERNDLLSSLTAELLDSTLTRADLDVRFGRAHWQPRVHPGDDHVRGYDIELAGAPHACHLSAGFREEPTATSVVHEVRLRRDRAPETPSTDESDLAGVLERFFRLVSFEPGGAPSYDWLDDVFIAGGRVIRTSGDFPEVSTVEAFVAELRRACDSGELTSFRQTELAARTEIFGNLAHRLSTIDNQGVRGGAGFTGRGVMSTQFVWVGNTWQISTMACDDERPGHPVPEDSPDG